MACFGSARPRATFFFRFTRYEFPCSPRGGWTAPLPAWWVGSTPSRRILMGGCRRCPCVCVRMWKGSGRRQICPREVAHPLFFLLLRAERFVRYAVHFRRRVLEVACDSHRHICHRLAMGPYCGSRRATHGTRRMARLLALRQFPPMRTLQICTYPHTLPAV